MYGANYRTNASHLFCVTVMARPVANFCDHHTTNVYVAILAGNMKWGQARIVCFVPVHHIVDDQIANVRVTIVGCKCCRSKTSPPARVLVIHVAHDELAKSEVAFESCPVQRGVSVAFGGGLFFQNTLMQKLKVIHCNKVQFE